MTAREATAELLERLRRHYIKPGPLPGGVFVPECGINGGPQSRADALYVGFTSTSGRILVGHEIKVSRADWRKELDTAGKADFWADNCHAWYIAAPGPDIVPAEEVPHGWGLMYPNPRTATRMDVKVRPVVHEDRVPSWQATRSILARLDTLRAAHDHDVLQAARTKAREEAAEEQLERRAQRSLSPEQSHRLEVLDRLEELFGSKIKMYGEVDVRSVAAALRLVHAGQDLGLDTDRYATDTLERAADRLLKGLAEWTDARAAFTTLVGEMHR